MKQLFCILLLLACTVLSEDPKKPATTIKFTGSHQCTGQQGVSRTYNLNQIDWKAERDNDVKLSHTAALPTDVTYPMNGKDITIKGGKLMFRVCNAFKLTKDECDDTTTPEASAFIVWTEKDNTGGEDKKCVAISLSEKGKTTFKAEIKQTTTTASDYLLTSIPADPKAKYTIAFKITCDEKATKVEPFKWVVTIAGTTISVSTTSASACGFNTKEALVTLLKDNKYIVMAVMIGMGLVFCFFGHALFKYTLMMTGFLMGAGVVLISVLWFKSDIAAMTSASKIIITVIAILMGILGGYLFAKFEKITVMISCGVLFFFMSKGMFMFFLVNLGQNLGSKLIYVHLCIGILGAIFGYYKKKLSLILGTAVGGTSLALASFVMMDGWLPSKSDTLGGKFFGWLAAWILISVIGIVVQCKSDKNSEKNEDYFNADEEEEDY